MRWFNTKDLLSSISALFSVSTAPLPSAPEQVATLEDIRRKMLALAVLEGGERSESLARRIRYAASVESLWYSRGELMGLLARAQGEAAAREKLEALSAMFTDLLPPGLRSRPSPLVGGYRNSRPGGDYRSSRPGDDA